MRHHQFFLRSVVLSSVAGFLVSIAQPAFAHHPMDGAMPSTMLEGLLSGIGHPIIGLDHLAFIVAMGIAAVLAGSRLLLPIVFIVATVSGTLLHLNSIGLPIVEVIVALSVATVGLMIMSGKKVSAWAYSLLFAITGLFHGHAYGEAVFGAEPTPVLAYLAGFSVTQYLIAIAAGYAVVDLIAKRDEDGALVPRLVGGMVAGAGGLLVGGHVLSGLGLA